MYLLYFLHEVYLQILDTQHVSIFGPFIAMFEGISVNKNHVPFICIFIKHDLQDFHKVFKANPYLLRFSGQVTVLSRKLN